MNRTNGTVFATGKNRQALKKHTMVLRSRTMAAVREFFGQNGFLEVETPIRIASPAPEPHIDAVAAGGQFLQASPELHMKRLLCAGYDQIFQICKCFRHNERGRLHLPEFTMLEWYAAGADYRDLMEQTEELIRFVCRKITGGNRLSIEGTEIDLHPGWPEMRLSEAFTRYAGMDMKNALSAGLFEEKLAFAIEPRLDRHRPVFLRDYPMAHTPLARSVKGDPDTARRFELYLAGIEICNGCNELTDAEVLRRRFETGIARRKEAGRPSPPLPERFLQEMTEMPDAAGCALGLDRLVMLLAGENRIDDAVAFVPEDDI